MTSHAPTTGTEADDHAAVLAFDTVEFRRTGRKILSDITWEVHAGERWVVLGPNGAGKTTLLQMASAYEAPSRGQVSVLGEPLGHTDMRTLRSRIGYVSQALARLVPGRTRARDLVLMGRDAKLRRFHDRYDEAESRPCRRPARPGRLPPTGADDPFEHLSAGEQQRVQIARALMADPPLLLLDEPSAGLDVVGREYLVRRSSVASPPARPPAIVFVTHHVEEIPAGFTHGLLLADGGVVAAGPLEEVLDDGVLSEGFRFPLTVRRFGDRYVAMGADADTRKDRP